MSRYIDVDALGIGRANPDVFIREEYASGWNLAIEIIENAPTADVAEVRRGKWQPCYEDWRKQIEGDECSACDFRHYGTEIRNYPYCPNCGARMDGMDGDME